MLQQCEDVLDLVLVCFEYYLLQLLVRPRTIRKRYRRSLVFFFVENFLLRMRVAFQHSFGQMDSLFVDNKE